MADEHVTTGDENKTTTVCDDPDDDESGDNWIFPNGEMAESAQSDERETDEASGRNDMQSSSDEWSPPSVEDYTFDCIQSDDVDKIIAQICGRFVSINPWKRLAGYGPQKIADNMNQHLSRWKIEKVRFAVVGRGATGKSTFINKLRGVKEGKPDFAGIGFGNKGQIITEYKHPVNENIIFFDVPGLSMKFNKLKFQELVNLASYDYIYMFFESVLTEDDEWLMVHIQSKRIPFCLIRSKVDNEVNSANGKNIGETGTLLQIHQTIKDSLDDKTAFATVELFLISSEKPYIGELSKLYDHMKEMLPSSLYSAVMLSLPMLTHAVAEMKLQELKKRVSFVSKGAGVISYVCACRANSLIIYVITNEVRHYVEVFGLDQIHNENIEGLQNDFSVVSVEDFVRRKIRENSDPVPPNIRSNTSSTSISAVVNPGRETSIFVDKLLSNILSELRQDAITIYMHMLKKDTG